MLSEASLANETSLWPSSSLTSSNDFLASAAFFVFLLIDQGEEKREKRMSVLE